jgi:uncharacterized protein (DUF2235 family)
MAEFRIAHLGVPMKRLILLFDGTWNTLAKPKEVTNVVRVGQALMPIAPDGVPQIVYYNSGVGSGGIVDQALGGVFGAGIRGNVQRGLSFLSFNYDSGEPENKEDQWGEPDEIYIFGFSRGAYTARALAGVLEAIQGIPKVSNFGQIEQLWSHYRKNKKDRGKQQEEIEQMVYPKPPSGKLIKCVAVWDTVGSYGIPGGLGLGGLARWVTSWTRNFRDNEIAGHIEYGFHAMAIDELRRAFSPTAWVRSKEDDARGNPIVEQVWFPGAHANVGGGYEQMGLSDHALVWMMARMEEQTGLRFQESYIQDNFFPCSACSVFRSYRGWWISSLLPAIRSIPKRIKAASGLGDAPAPGDILDGRLHWSVKERLGKRSLVDLHRYWIYRPKNVMAVAQDTAYTECAGREKELVELCRQNALGNEQGKQCALYCALGDIEKGGWFARRRAKRMRRLREEWKNVIGASQPMSM